MADCCRDFTRSQALRVAAARAGQGLPAIEPGMPLPAGTGLSRRSFLSRTAGLGLAVYGGRLLAPGLWEDGIAAAAGGPAAPVLVNVFLEGGADSLSILAPAADPTYQPLRGDLALDPATTATFADDPSLHWHPDATPLRTLHEEGKVAVFPAIGYDHPDQSHFTSRHFWEVGALDPASRYGWLGRYLDLHGTMDNPVQGLSLDWSLAPALAAAKVPVAAVSNPADFSMWSPGVGDPVQEPMLAAIGTLARTPAGDTAGAYARAVAGQVDTLRGQLAPFDGVTDWGSQATYPAGDAFAGRLAALASMLDAGLPVRCVTLTAPGGYDTHSGQAAALSRNLQDLSGALLAFQRDLEARTGDDGRPLADRVLTLVWSEFGRRPQANGGGTDHGAAGAAFLIGSRVKPTMVGEFTGLTTLDPQGNLRPSSDFRALYGALLEQWLSTTASDVLPGIGSFTLPDLVGPSKLP
jgi:uncharacterized protein (DUF1501 family)